MTDLITIKPQMSEKAYRQSEELNTYVFVVPAGVNADQIAQSVVRHYGVSVASVRLASRASKPLRLYRKRGRYLKAKHRGLKKAYVTLQAGDKLPLFAETKDDKSKIKESR